MKITKVVFGKMKHVFDTEGGEFISHEFVSQGNATYICPNDNRLAIIKEPLMPNAIILCLNDSDDVTDLGVFSFTKSNKHVIEESVGSCDLFCPETKHKYKHIINDPNKNELICRGCGKTV